MESVASWRVPLAALAALRLLEFYCVSLRLRLGPSHGDSDSRGRVGEGPGHWAKLELAPNSNPH